MAEEVADSSPNTTGDHAARLVPHLELAQIWHIAVEVAAGPSERDACVSTPLVLSDISDGASRLFRQQVAHFRVVSCSGSTWRISAGYGSHPEGVG